MLRTLRVLGVAAVMGLASAYVSAQSAEAEKMLIANERAINDAVVKGNVAIFKQHVSADGWSIDPMGGRAPVSDFLKNFEAMAKDMKITSWDISDTRTIWVDKNTAVLTYKWTGSGTMQDKPIPSPVWCSTVWTNRNGKWTAIFHQESPAPPAP